MGRFCSKSAGIKLRRRLYVAALAALSNSAYALPQGGKVTAGDASIQDAGDSMNIHQDSQRVVLDFDSYNVDANETVNYIQPNSDSVALNRVLGSELSEIHGAINANGHVYLINPNGVLFGEGAQVNVSGLVATTLDIDNQNFIDQREQFEGASDGTVNNQGHISARNRVVLMAPDVLNSGDIQVPSGEIMLRSGNSVLLHSTGSEIPILVEDPQLSGHVVNDGSLSASRVALVLDGQAGRDIYDSAINNHGLVRAVSVTGEGGNIELLAASSDVINTGHLDASANNGDGGTVNVEAHRYAQTGELNASGANVGNGGFANVHAIDTIVLHTDSQSHIDGGMQGNGGKMIVYADNATWYREGSAISARGGEVLGDGGFVEVSGRNVVAVESPVDIGATNGQAGLWYIDPTDITVQEGPANTNGDFVASGDDYTFTLDLPAQATSTINNLSLQDTLVNFGNVYLDTASNAPGTGNITFDAMIDFIGIPAGRVMSLRADNDIVFRGGAGFTHTNNGNWSLNLEMNAGGSITFEDGAAVAFRGGSINATAMDDFSLLGNALIVGGGDINIDAGNDIIMAADSLLNSGAFQTTLTAGNNVTLADITTTNTTADAISVTATAGQILDDGNSANGLHALEGGIYLQAVNGIDDIALEAAELGVHNTLSGDVALNNSGDLSLNRLALGANTTMSITASGSLTYVGAVGNNFDSVTDSILNLTAGTEMVINGRIADETGSSDHDLDINLVAGTNLSILDGSVLSSGFGVFNVQALNGDAAVTGLNTQAMVNNAITVSALNGQIVDGGDSRLDLYAPDGGFFLRSMGDIGGLESETNTFDVVAAGNIELSDVASFTAERLEAGGTVTINATNGFAIRNTAIVNATDFTINASELIRLPNTELRVTGTMTLNGSDILQQDGLRQVDLAANTLVLNSDFVGGDVTINSDAQFLNLSNSGADTVTLINSSDLSLTHYEATAGSSIIQTASGFDLTVANAINLEGNTAALTLNAGNGLLLNNNIADATGAVDNTTQLFLLAGGDIQQSAISIVNGGAGDLVLNAGGDLSLAAMAGGSAAVTAGGNITDANGAAVNITAPSVSLLAGGNIGTDLDALESSSNALVIDAADAFITNDGALGLTITAVDNVSVTLSSGDLTLASAPVVAGDLTLATASNGDVIIDDSGLSLANALTVTADNFRDSDNDIAFAASNANITLRDGAVDQTWNTSLNSLATDITGAGSLIVINNDSLLLNSVTTGGAIDIRTSSGDLTVSQNPVVSGDLQLSAAEDLVVPAVGLNHVGDLTLAGSQIRDDDNTINVTASALTIRQDSAASDVIFNTNVDILNLAFNGLNPVFINELNQLQLDALTVGGDASIAAAGNITVTNGITVPGTLNVQTTGTGLLQLPDGGLSTAGDWLFDVASLQDTDQAIRLSANTADITLRNQLQGLTINSDVSQLSLSHTAGGAIQLLQAGELTLNRLSAGGDVNIVTDRSLLFNDANPVLLGDLSLTVADALTITVDGLNLIGDLTVDANAVANLSGIGATHWEADNLNLTVNSVQNNTLEMQVNSLSLAFGGLNPLAVNLGGPTTISAVSALADLSLNSTGDLQFLTDASLVDGAFDVQTTGAIELLDAGLSATELSLQANNLISASGGAVRLSGNNANLILTGNQPLMLMTELASLSVNATAANVLSVSNAGDLLLSDWQAPNATSITLASTGVLQIPEDGVQAGSRLSINAMDLNDGDRTLNFSAPELLLALTNAQGEHNWQLNGGVLDVELDGQASLNILSDTALTLQDLNGDNQAVNVSDGNFHVLVNDGDLTIESNIAVSDLTADGERNGIVDLAVANGDIYVGQLGDVALTSRVNVGGLEPAPVLAVQNGIRLRLLDSTASERKIVLGNGNSTVILQTIGSDIELNAWADGTAEGALRSVIQAGGVQIQAYNTPTDALTGRVIVNGESVTAEPWQQIREDRTLTIVTAKPFKPYELEEVLDNITDADDSVAIEDEVQVDGENIEYQFEKVFGNSCSELDQGDVKGCRINAALKAFLSHWLVGGELPPSSEI